MRNIKLFENFDGDMGSGKGSSPKYSPMDVICIASDGGWNAVGMIYPGDEKYIDDLIAQDPSLMIETFRSDREGDFIALDGQGMDPMWKLVTQGDTYTSNDGFVFPIIGNGKFFVGLAAGHTVDFDIVTADKLKDL